MPHPTLRGKPPVSSAVCDPALGVQDERAGPQAAAHRSAELEGHLTMSAPCSPAQSPLQGTRAKQTSGRGRGDVRLRFIDTPPPGPLLSCPLGFGEDLGTRGCLPAGAASQNSEHRLPHRHFIYNSKVVFEKDISSQKKESGVSINAALGASP